MSNSHTPYFVACKRDVPTQPSQPEHTTPEKKAIADNSRNIPFFPRRILQQACTRTPTALSRSRILTILHDDRFSLPHHTLTAISVLGRPLPDETRRTRKLPSHAKPSPTSTTDPKLPPLRDLLASPPHKHTHQTLCSLHGSSARLLRTPSAHL